MLSERERMRVTGWITLIGAGAGAMYCAVVQQFDRYPEGLSFLFPGVILLALLPAGVFLVTRRDGDPVPSPPRPSKRRTSFPVVVFLTCAYLPMIELVGFPPATFAFQLAVLAFGFNKRGVAWLIGAPAVATAAFTFLFDTALSVPLPRGVGVFYALNALII